MLKIPYAEDYHAPPPPHHVPHHIEDDYLPPPPAAHSAEVRPTIPVEEWNNKPERERGLFITLVLKFYNDVFLLVGLTTLETLVILIGWIIRLSV